MTTPAFDAVVLAGGRGSRLGGVDKAAITLHGARLVDRAAAAAREAGARRVVVVGPEHAGSAGTVVVREDPPFAGPLAALAAALPVVDAEWLLLLSCDLVRPERVSALLLGRPLDDECDGVLLQDGEGRAQWLAGLYRVSSLRSGLQALGAALDNAPLRALLGELRLRRIDAPDETTADIDDPHDLERARRGTDAVPPLERGAERTVETRRADDSDASADPRTKETDMSDSKHLPPQALDEWLTAAAAELGIAPESVSIGTVLDVARDVAHDVARPAAPLSTFLLGVAVGRSDDPRALQELAARITARAAEWKAANA